MTRRLASPGRAVDRAIDLGDGREVNGFVEQGYGAVMDAFLANFRLRHDLGAACSAFVDGRCVADHWGGIADARTKRPWGPDTTALIVSCSKGLLAICAYLLKQEGRLDLDEPVATYWPAFAANGKDRITVRDAMSHRAGLASLDLDLGRGTRRQLRLQ